MQKHNAIENAISIAAELCGQSSADISITITQCQWCETFILFV